MRKWLAMILSVSLVVSSFFALGSAVSAESKFKITEDAELAARIKNFADIKALFTDKTDLNAVKKFYVENFQTEVKRIDVIIKPDDPKIDENITIVLDNAIAGSLSVGQAKQAIDKGLQWYFYFALRDLISTQVRPALKTGDYAAATTAFYKVVQIYEGVLQATVVKRDNTFSLHMADILKGTIEQLLSDLETKNADDFNVHRQVLDKTLIKTYALAAFTYAKNIPTKPAADQPTAMTEGYFLFMPVYTYLRGGSQADADYIRNAFASGDASKIDTNKIQDAMQRAMIGKVSEYVNQAFVKLEAGDLQAARGYAMEGNMFLSTQEVFLGAETYAAAAVYAQQFADAVDKSDLASAKKYGFQVLKFLVVKDGMQLKVGAKSYQLNGKNNTTDVAPYINAKTNRTLVPVRVIAEALDAKVEYVPASKAILIVKDGKTTELKIGSAQVVQDGKVNADVILEQPVLLNNNRSFIPLRAVAELFGKGVFYDKGEIIILR